MFPERTALLRPDERTRLIYRQKDIKSEYMANSISKEYIIALSTKNLDDYKRVAFSSYSGTAYTDVCTNAFGLVKVEVNGAPAYVPHQMDVTGGYSGAPLYALNPKKQLRFYWNPLPEAMRDAGYSYKIKYTLNGTDYPVTASSYNNNLLFQIIPVNSYSYQTEVQKLGITVELYKDGEPLRLSGASNMFLMRYRMMSETDVAIPEVTLTVKDGDLIAASAATDSPITVSEGEDCGQRSRAQQERGSEGKGRLLSDEGHEIQRRRREQDHGDVALQHRRRSDLRRRRGGTGVRADHRGKGHRARPGLL